MPVDGAVEMPIRAVVFDLDGTLLDTASEIALALDRTFSGLGAALLPKAAVERLIGRGVASLVERALAQVGATAVDPHDAIERFEAHYAALVATAALPYPGVREGIALLGAQRVPMAVVTNKPRYFTECLLERTGLLELLSIVVAGDDGLPRKPAADMLTAAFARMGRPAGETLMLGDSSNDVEAARRAGCRVWCVPYGYNEGRPATTLACDRLVETVEAAARLIVHAPPEGADRGP